MPRQERPNPASSIASTNAFVCRDVSEILREQGWLLGDISSGQLAWCERASALLGPQVSDRRSLGDALRFVFQYDAQGILAKVETHAVLSRYGARDVIRHLALLLLDGAPLTSERFKEIISILKERLGIGSREIFHPIRLALTGEAGEGVLDRVILLLEDAAGASFAVHVKSARERVVEFCAALD